MGLDVWIWMGGNPFLGAFEGVGTSYGLLPHPNPYDPPHINIRYINNYNCEATCRLIFELRIHMLRQAGAQATNLRFKSHPLPP
jgi:hypothetical protein